MPVNGDAASRDMWVGHIERFLVVDMTVKEWCAFNKVAEFSLCKRRPASVKGARPLPLQVERGIELNEGHAPRHCSRSHLCDFWAVSQEMDVDFAMGPGLLCGFRRGVVCCRLRRPGETPALGGVSGRFGLRNRPEAVSGVRLR